jgi:hypothetical protein
MIDIAVMDDGETVTWNVTHNGEKIKDSYNITVNQNGVTVSKGAAVPNISSPPIGRHERRRMKERGDLVGEVLAGFGVSGDQVRTFTESLSTIADDISMQFSGAKNTRDSQQNPPPLQITQYGPQHRGPNKDSESD